MRTKTWEPKCGAAYLSTKSGKKIRLKMDEDKMDEDISMMKTIPGL